MAFIFLFCFALARYSAKHQLKRTSICELFFFIDFHILNFRKICRGQHSMKCVFEYFIFAEDLFPLLFMISLLSIWLRFIVQENEACLLTWCIHYIILVLVTRPLRQKRRSEFFFQEYLLELLMYVTCMYLIILPWSYKMQYTNDVRNITTAKKCVSHFGALL